MACVALVALWLVRIVVRPVTDPDAWLHLRMGAYLNAGGKFSELPDPFVTAASYVYVPGQWLPQRLGAAVYDLVGLGGVAAMRSIGIVIVLGSLWWLMRGLADRDPAALALVTAILPATPALLAERPQVLSLAFLAVLLGAWFRTLHDDRVRWWLLALMWVWASVHGLWVVGVALSAAFAVVHALDHGRLNPRMAALPFLMLGVAALTPNGPALVLSPLRVADSAIGTIQEWQAAPSDSPWLLFMLLPAAVVATLWWRTATPRWSRVLLFGIAIGLGLSMARLIVVGAFILSALLAEALQTQRGANPVAPSRLERSLAVVIPVATAALVGGLALVLAGKPGSAVPTSLAQQLGSSPTGTVVLADHELTGWIEWVAPNTRQVVDLRAELYRPDTLESYAGALRGESDWRRFIDHHRVTLIVTGRDSPLNELLPSSGWLPQASTDDYVLYVKPER